MPPAAKLVTLPYGERPSQVGDLRVPRGSGPFPVLVVVHGGFWLDAYGRDLMDALCDALTDAGVATWNIEYRRLGERGGGWPGTFLDVGAATDLLASLAVEHALDATRVGAIGHSAGGHLALWLAARPMLAADRASAASSELLGARRPLRVGAVVSLGGVVELARAQALGVGGGVVERLVGGTPRAMPERYAAADPRALLPLRVRQHLLHGEADAIVPASLSTDYAGAASRLGEPVAVSVLPSVGHFEPIDPGSAAWPEVRAAALAAVA